MAAGQEQLGSGDRRGDGVALTVYIGMFFEAVAMACSSPQTAELNAKARSATLMKWVRIGIGLGWGVLALAFVCEAPGKRWRPVLSGVVATAVVWWQYAYALHCGMRSNEPGTETYTAVPGATVVGRRR